MRLGPASGAQISLAQLLRIIIIFCMSDSVNIPLRSDAVQPPAVEGAPRGPAVACLRSEALFGKAREILIEHAGSYYRLRVTQSNKLILTK